jgi:hypothetical protein
LPPCLLLPGSRFWQPQHRTRASAEAAQRRAGRGRSQGVGRDPLTHLLCAWGGTGSAMPATPGGAGAAG